MEVQNIVETSSSLIEKKLRNISFQMMKDKDNINYTGMWPDSDVEDEMWSRRTSDASEREIRIVRDSLKAAGKPKEPKEVYPGIYRVHQHFEPGNPGMHVVDGLSSPEPDALSTPSANDSNSLTVVPEMTDADIKAEIRRLEQYVSQERKPEVWHAQQKPLGETRSMVEKLGLDAHLPQKTRSRETDDEKSRSSGRRRKHRDAGREREREKDRDRDRRRRRS
jgi:hypothetical protein